MTSSKPVKSTATASEPGVPSVPADVAEQTFDNFVPDSVKENYRQIARDRAATNGTTPKAELAKLGAAFADQHTADPLGGYEYLAAWAKAEGDPGDGGVANAEAFEVARAVESAKREPKLAMQSHPEAVAAAEAVLAESPSTPTYDADSGVVPNPGPAPA